MDLYKTMQEYGVSEEQAKALDVEKNIALHAGAGSGKTRVLSRRFLKLMLEKEIDVDSVVAITFTKKAALEMKERVRELVNKKIIKEQDQKRLIRLNAIKEQLQAANISTFHSFCDKILRENCSLVGLDPMYQILEDVDRETLITKILRQQIDEMMVSGNYDEGFKELFGLYGIDYYFKEGLFKDIKYLYSKIREKAMGIDEVRNITLGNIARFYKEKGEECFEKKDLLESIEIFIVTILKKVDEVFSRFKREKDLVDFNDLEIFTITLLEDENLREHYRRRFKYFLVDEFQDTNEVQQKILYALTVQEDGSIPPGSLFIVGDGKQAIYGFRGASYAVFSSATQKINENGEKLELSTCYRSHPDIVKAVNSIFENLFTNYAPLKNVEDYRGRACVEYCLVKRQKNDSNSWKYGKTILKKGTHEEVKAFLDEFLTGGPQAEISHPEREAEELALKIKALKTRGFEYRDMAILLRSRTNLLDLEESLRKNGIPYCVIGGIGFFEKQEIVDMMNILKYVYDPDDKAAMLGVLRSPYVGVPDDLLLVIFDKLGEEGKLKEVLIEKSLPESDPWKSDKMKGRRAKPDVEGLIRALDLLKEMRKLAPYYNVYDFVRLIIERFHVKEFLLSLDNGAAMYRNIEKFINITRDFDSKDLYSPRDFIDYIRNLQEVSDKESEAVLDTEDSNAVKIMTIHSAKGLEFEAVFIPEIERDLLYNVKHQKPYFQFSGEYGIIARFDDKITGEKGDENKLYDFIRDNALKRQLEESKRLLYVAATRAKRYLCFVGEDVELKDDEKLDSFVKMLKSALDEKAIKASISEFDKSQESCEANAGADGIIKNQGDEIDAYVDAYDGEGAGRRIFKDQGNLTDGRSERYILPKNLLDRLEFSCGYTAKSSFSISRYFTFRDCPRKFFYIYKAGLKTFDFEKDVEVSTGNGGQVSVSPSGLLKGVVKGKLIHRMLERINENAGNPDEIIKQYVGLNTEAEVKEIKKIMENYKAAEAKYEKIKPFGRIKTKREIPFAVPLYEGKTKTIYGIIDRLDIFDNNGSQEACLIDYKTNRIEDKQDIKRLLAHYRPQFILYGLGFERLYPKIYPGIRLTGMYIFFLDVGEVVEVRFDKKEREEFLSELDLLMDFIESHDSMEDYRCKSFCDRKCEFALLCE